MRRLLGLCIVFLLAGCAPPPAQSGLAQNGKAEPEVRFVVLVKPSELEVLNGQLSEPTVVLYWKMRSHWARGSDPVVALAAHVEPAGRGVRAVVKETTMQPPPPERETEIPVPLVISVAETAPAGDYVVHISGQIPDAPPRSATIKVRVPPRE